MAVLSSFPPIIGTEIAPFTRPKPLNDITGKEEKMDTLHTDQWAQLLRSLSRNIDALISGSGHHSVRVAYWSEMVARVLKMPDAEVQIVYWGALLHDIGKIALPQEILEKKGALNAVEWSYMELHPTVGANLVRIVPSLLQVAPIVLAHQEKFNGQGYPYGLQGQEIPLGARILAVVDAYDAMTDDRPYRQPFSHEEAVAELRRNRGQHFDPLVVDVFCSVLETRPAPQWVM